MSKILKKLYSIVAIFACAGLAGCYESKASLINSEQAVTYLNTGQYCRYDYDSKTEEYGETCNPETLKWAATKNSYLANIDDYQRIIRVDGRPVSTGIFAGQYIGEACSYDKNYPQPYICVYGALDIQYDGTVIWTAPQCEDGTDSCPIANYQELRQLFEGRDNVYYKARYKYVLQGA